MAVKFRRESFDEWLVDARFMIEGHAEESGAALGSALNINHDQYVEFERQKCLYIFCGRNEKNELVAYWMGLMIPNLFYKHFITVYALGYFARKDYRGFTVVRMIKFVENYFKEKGVKNIVQNARTRNRMGRILEKLGYRKVEEIYTKVF